MSAEVLGLTTSGEYRLMSGVIHAARPDLLVALDEPLPSDLRIAGAPVIANGHLVGLVTHGSAKQLTAVPCEEIAEATEQLRPEEAPKRAVTSDEAPPETPSRESDVHPVLAQVTGQVELTKPAAPDLVPLLTAAASLLPQKMSEIGVMSSTTVFLAAVEWADDPNAPLGAPAELRTLAELVTVDRERYARLLAGIFRSVPIHLSYDPDPRTFEVSRNLQRAFELAQETSGPQLSAADVVRSMLQLAATPDGEPSRLADRLRNLGLEPAELERGLARGGAPGAPEAATVGLLERAVGVADTVPLPGSGRVRRADLLGVTDEVEMLVSVLLAKDTPLPLAVGLFGDWGTGKSFFMALMEERMNELSQMAVTADPEAFPYCGNVRTVRFNAWHYVDADLWASMAATLFDELAKATTADRADQALAQLDQARADVEVAKAERIDLEREFDVLELESGKAAAAWRPSLKVALHALHDDGALASNLKAIAEGQVDVGARPDPNERDRPAEDAARLAEALGAAETFRDRARDARSLFQEEVTNRSKSATLVSLLVLLMVAVAVSWGVGLDAGQKALSFVIAVLASLTPAVAATSRILLLAREAREARERPLEHKREELARARGAEELAQREADRRESELQEMRDRGLQLQNFVRERAASADYRNRLGVMSQVRRDFEQLVILIPSADTTGPPDDVGSESQEGDEPSEEKRARVKNQIALAEEVKKRLPEVERIVLFIDDLDRCPDEKVVEVLQAVHLLLAFKLFVVVVGVDSRWLERSLKAQFATLLDDPAQYLEKIFQIPYVLRRMSPDSYRELIKELTPEPTALKVSSETARYSASTPVSPRPQGAIAGSGTSATGTAEVNGDTPNAPERRSLDSQVTGNSAREAKAALPRVELKKHTEAVGPASQEAPLAPRRSRALFLTGDERQLLGALDRLILTPRSTKRLVNIYRMLRVSVPDSELGSFGPEKGREFEVVVVLVGILVGRPADTSEVFTSLMAEPDGTLFKDFLKAKHPTVYAPLKELLPGIRPHDISVYQRWAPRVARFSFRLAAGLHSSVQDEQPLEESAETAHDVAHTAGFATSGDAAT